MGFGNAGSSMETWNTGCTTRKLSGSRRVTEWVPGCARILRAKKLVRKFLRWSGSTKELSLDKCFTTDWEFGCSGSSGICSNLVAALCVSYMHFEFLVKLIKICDEVTGARRCKVALGMNSNVRVVAFVGIEGSDSDCSTRRIVVGELS